MLKHRGFPGRMPGSDFQFTIRRANVKEGATKIIRRERFKDRKHMDRMADSAFMAALWQYFGEETFERGNLEPVRPFLAPAVFEAFEAAVNERKAQGLTVTAEFLGLRELTLIGAEFATASREAEVTVRFGGELLSVGCWGGAARGSWDGGAF